jgi:hypothetical protein
MKVLSFIIVLISHLMIVELAAAAAERYIHKLSNFFFKICMTVDSHFAFLE